MKRDQAILHYQRGFIPSQSDDQDSFEQRISEKLQWSEHLWENDLDLSEEGLLFKLSHRFPKEVLLDDGGPIQKKFECLPDWVPAYHTNQGLPFLTGGMAVELSSPQASPQVFFQLKEAYKTDKKWLIYPRSEILSHEMCHVVRFPLESHRYEETIAYSISSSPLRRYLGGALLSSRDNLFLLAGILSWVSIDFLYLLEFGLGEGAWLIRLILPLLVILGLIRNANIHRELRRAKRALTNIFDSKTSERVIFCLSDDEIRCLSKKHSKRELVQWWMELPGFRGEFLRNVFPDVEEPV